MNPKKDSLIVWEALNYLTEEQWSPKQISGHMKIHGKLRFIR